MKGLCSTWLAVCPHTYFSGIFLESANWNRPFVTVFDKSDMLNAEGCFNLTQAYYLKHLKQLNGQDPKYKKLSLNEIESNMRAKMASGDAIIRAAAEFEKAIHDMSCPEDFVWCYMEKMLSILYLDEEKRSLWLSELWRDSMTLLGLLMFTNESLKTAKEIDSQCGNVIKKEVTLK